MTDIVYVTPKKLYESKMSVGRRLYVESLSHAGCSVRVTGPGWEDWPASNDVRDWLVQHDPLAIIAYKTENVMGLEHVNCPVACIFNEANDRKKTLDDIEAAKATDVFFHHAGDYALWLSELSRMGIRCHLIHHCAPENPNGNRSYSDRPIDIGLCGVISREIYPIRTSFAKSGICTVRPHPGYRITNVMGQYEDYMDWLSQVKVLICCSSRYKYPLAKIHEGLAAGCTVISDAPLCPFLAGVPYLQWIDRDRANKLCVDSGYARELEPELLSLAELATNGSGPKRSLKNWENNFTMSHWADNVLNALGAK